MLPVSDAVVWASFLAGDERAFETIFARYYRVLHGYGLRLTDDTDLTQDSIQNLFQRLWQRRAALRPVADVRPYLFKALRHEIGTALKAQQRRTLLYQAAEPEFKVQYSPEDFLIAQQLTDEQQAQLLAALGALSNRQREAIHLKFFDGLDYDRISQIMDLHQQSIRNLVYQALKLLRQSLLLPLMLRVALAVGGSLLQ